MPGDEDDDIWVELRARAANVIYGHFNYQHGDKITPEMIADAGWDAIAQTFGCGRSTLLKIRAALLKRGLRFEPTPPTASNKQRDWLRV